MIRIPSWILNTIGTSVEDLKAMRKLKAEIDEKVDSLLQDPNYSWCTYHENQVYLEYKANGCHICDINVVEREAKAK